MLRNEVNGSFWRQITEWLKKEMILTMALGLGILSCLWVKPELDYINFEVLILLFNLMLIIAAFKHYKVLDFLAITLLNRSKSMRQTGYFLVGLTFAAAMFMTNDVALITFIPLTLVVGKMLKENVMKWIIFQTLAANLGSSLTPMGNPQNLFIYTSYKVNLLDFMAVTLGMTAVAVIFLGILIYRLPNKDVTYKMKAESVCSRGKVAGFGVLFLIVLGSVIGLVDYRVAFAVVVVFTILIEKKLFMEVDYTLLISFIGFFVFVGNLSAMPQIKGYLEGLLNHSGATYFGGIFLSQIISNVPAAMLLAPFTENWRELLLGVDVGGMGTIIASMASVISYKLYVEAYPEEQMKYLKSFTFYNLLGLAVFVPLVAAFIWIF